MKKRDKNIQFADIVMTENVRSDAPGGDDIVNLAYDIGENGLQVRIEVASSNARNTVPDDKFLTMRGHRRTEAIGWLKQNEPKLYEAQFNKGVPVTIIDGFDDAEILDRKVDHGNEKSLSNMYEVLRCAIFLFLANFTEKQVAVKLSGLMDRLSPMKASKKKEVNELREKKAEATGDEAVTLAKKIDELILNYRRGSVQLLNNIRRLPIKVQAAFYRKVTGIVPTQQTPGLHEWAPCPLPSSITTAQITKLFKAFKDDLEIMENGVSKHNRRLPGPSFNAEWDKILADDAEKQNKKEPRAKAMSANDMKKELTDGKYNSKLAKMVTTHHTGEKVDGAELSKYDQVAYYAELLADHNPDEWDAFVDAAKAVEATLVEAAAETTEEEPAEAAA